MDTERERSGQRFTEPKAPSWSRREVLLDLVRSVGPGQAVSVPAAWIEEALAEPPAIDYTVEQAAGLIGRRPSTVRTYCETGFVPGAYKHLGRWRLPLEGLRAFLARPGAVTEAGRASSHSLARPGFVRGDWRRHLRAEGGEEGAAA